MSLLADAILITWQRNRAYAMRLVNDLTDSHIVAQPCLCRAPINHPGWILSHLGIYAPVVATMMRGGPFSDPILHPFGQMSKLSLDPAHYPGRDALVGQFCVAHDDAEAALHQVSDEALHAPTPLERWRGQHPRLGEMLVTLMVKHESFHLGQLSAWRRAIGLPSVAL